MQLLLNSFMTVGDELKQAIKSQVEFYFSKGNLANDAYLVSQMNSQMYDEAAYVLQLRLFYQSTISVLTNWYDLCV